MGGRGEWNCELVVNPQRSAGDFKHSCPEVEPTHFEKKAEKSSYLTLCLENPPFLEKEKYAARIKYLYQESHDVNLVDTAQRWNDKVKFMGCLFQFL